MSTTKNLTSLNIQINSDMYAELKKIAREKQVSLASLFREFSESIVNNYAKTKTQIIVLEPSIPIIISEKTLNDDYNPIPVSNDDEIPAFRLPSSVRFQSKNL